jgi:hypothetical protein
LRSSFDGSFRYGDTSHEEDVISGCAYRIDGQHCWLLLLRQLGKLVAAGPGGRSLSARRGSRV